MSLDVPVSWHSYLGPIGPDEKWDMRWVGRMLRGEEGRPAGAYRFIQTPFDPDDGLGRVLVMPMGDYKGAAGASAIPGRLLRDLNKLPWCVLIATSDECSTFRWDLLDPWPEHVRLWVMTPRVGREYPLRTRFIGEGSPTPAETEFAVERDLDLYFSGQVGTNDRRKLALPAMRAAALGSLDAKLYVTPGFLQAGEQGGTVTKPGGDQEYMHDLTRTWIAPAPAGTCTQDTFRLYEALEAGCIPIADELSQQGNRGYWKLLGLNRVFPTIEDWSNLPKIAEGLLVFRHPNAARVSARWQQYKRKILQDLHGDVASLLKLRKHEPPHDAITVVVVTSPVPSNPDLAMIQDLVASVRVNLPEAEILIACDQPREEMAHRVADYDVFLHRLCVWTNAQFNITPFIADRHSHESGLLKMVMPFVETEFVLFMEHDCPLIQPADFQACLDEMSEHDLRHLRFGHEAYVLPEHAYLYPFGVEPAGNHIKTVQYSSRPALYTTELMRELLDTYFADDATCMIESVLYGPFQTDTETMITPAGPDQAFADRLRMQAAWRRYRSALWAPGTNLAFSGHVDGRKDDPNVPIVVKYPGGVVPPGAPAEGEWPI